MFLCKHPNAHIPGVVMADRFRPINRDTPHLFPPSVQDYVADDHLARFVVDIVDQLDLSPLTMAYGGRGGSAAWHPAMLLSLLFYGYATGTFPVASSKPPPTTAWPCAIFAPISIPTTTASCTVHNHR